MANRHQSHAKSESVSCSLGEQAPSKVGNSETELVVKATGSNGVKTHSDIPAVEGERNQPAQKNKHSVETVKKSQNLLTPDTKEVWRVKEKANSSKDSSTSTSKVSHQKEKAEPSNYESKLSSSCKKEKGKEKAEPSKDESKLSSSCKKEKGKEKAEPSKDESKLSSTFKKKKGKKKVEPSKVEPELSSRAWCRKEKAHPSKDESKLYSENRSSEPGIQSIYDGVHHIKWDGFDEPEPLGQDCWLCGVDLAYSAVDDAYEEDDNLMLPEVAVLPCGHLFHFQCLQSVVPEELLSDPQCFICASLL